MPIKQLFVFEQNNASRDSPNPNRLFFFHHANARIISVLGFKSNNDDNNDSQDNTDDNDNSIHDKTNDNNNHKNNNNNMKRGGLARISQHQQLELS